MATLPESGSDRFLPVKRELFLFTVASCTLKKGGLDLRDVSVHYVGYLSKEIVSELALYVLIGLILNLTKEICLDYDYSELDRIIEVLQDDICCDLVLYK